MDQIRKSPLELLVQERTGRDLDELLRELYVDQRHTHKAIADALTRALRQPGSRVARTTVKLWLAKRGITRDDRPTVTL